MTVRRISIDFHGVIDTNPKYFSDFTKIMSENCIEIFILTGGEDTPKMRKDLEDYGIRYHHFISIVDYRRDQGIEVVYKDGLPWMDDHAWNSAKADYCYTNHIDLHIDDTEVYGEFFQDENKFMHWNKG